MLLPFSFGTVSSFAWPNNELSVYTLFGPEFLWSSVNNKKLVEGIARSGLYGSFGTVRASDHEKRVQSTWWIAA